MRTATKLLFVLAIPVAGMVQAEEEPAASPDLFTPAHALQRVLVIHADLDLIRLEMGKPPCGRALLKVENAAPREVYFQALTLFRKANRLAYEHTRKKVNDPPLPQGTIAPAHVHEMLLFAGERLDLVKKELAIGEDSPAPPLSAGVEPTDVFAQIVEANRTINGLLDERFAPGDVFQQLTVAIAYTSRLLDRPGQRNTPPDAPAFERGKRPADVYRRLLKCFDEIREVAEISQQPILNLVLSEELIDEAEPSDVYDFSALLVAELAFFHDQLPGADPPRATYSPGRKLPSHVYQRAGILLAQLDSVIVRAREDPAWLNATHEPSPVRP